MKTIPSALTTHLVKDSLLLATLVTITRTDGKVVRLTDHSSNITYNNDIYKSDPAFSISDITASAKLSDDKIVMDFMTDESVLTISDFRAGLYKFAEVLVDKINYESPSDGTVRLRRGYISNITLNENNFVSIEIVGMIQALQMSVGRVATPGCTASLGDSRCRLAIDFGQHYFFNNKYRPGDWVYKYDTAEMTAFSLTNSSFDSGSALDGTAGWTMYPTTGDWKIGSTDDGTTAPYSGANALFGEGATNTAVIGDITYVTRSISLTSSPGNTLVDAGKIVFAMLVNCIQTKGHTETPVKLYAEQLDTNGNVIRVNSTKWLYMDTVSSWKEKCLAFPVIKGARTIVIKLMMSKQHATAYYAAFDSVRAYWWDRTANDPFHGTIFKCKRVVSYGAQTSYRPANPSFDKQGSVANTDTAGAISGWTIGASSFWRTTTGIWSLTPTEGARFLAGGDSGSGVQETYSISNTFNVPTAVSRTRIDDGDMVFHLELAVKYGGTASHAKIVASFLNSSGSVISSTTLMNFTANAGAPISVATELSDVMPANTRKVKLTLYARSPVGDSIAKIGYDKIKYWFKDRSRSLRGDPTTGAGNSTTSWDYTIGNWTYDATLFWKASANYVSTDTVDTVTDTHKVFTGTIISGTNAKYQGAEILWLTGNNAGTKSIIRKFTGASKTIKLYGETTYAIQSGDRFEVIQPCHKRFADCSTTFDNALNFRGFPHVPSKLQK